MSLKPCLECGELSVQSRCPEHRVKRAPQSQAGNIRNTHRWKKLSARMRKASPFCEICGATSPLVADHIIPIAEDPSMAYEPLNLRVLCVRDNAARKDRCTPEERDAVHAAIAARKARAARAHASRENHTNS